MPGTAFDGSVWVTGLQASGVAVGGFAGALIGGVLLNRIATQQQKDAIAGADAAEAAEVKARRRKLERPPPQKPDGLGTPPTPPPNP
mmetsp:Transcript_10297/g.17738  ORF Transcript_10297/g.17738 Transcript_10297/m.17738 type:complete len:87 (+) Transcript_10297:121-381(+)|eukprot:CAMPEP_0198213802 /NCGR_PEP_ID=MMETSP1445-20131203/33528_1 /TAXON_ID=36898 /ORGANISM="Pyramimonas sp., Strain CCMP2087" /LENGTH=86 /DNA_ID=CAMNT_0043888593 /DNA_START=118 /DNA_END=378 /DNA_ORIENTATION=-